MRKTWGFLDIDPKRRERLWAEWIVIVLILATGFASGLVILNGVTRQLPPCGTSQPTDHCEPQYHQPEEMRWDQGYLNQFRAPCPAVYNAPNGDLQECL